MSLILTLLREALDADRTAAGDTQRKLDLILERQDQMSKQLDDLAAQVAANDSAMAAAEALMMGLHDQIVAAGTDAAKLDALTADLSANASKLAASVVANTPAAVAPTAPVAAEPAVLVAPGAPVAAPAVPVVPTAPTQPATTVAAPEAPVPVAPITTTTTPAV